MENEQEEEDEAEFKVVQIGCGGGEDNRVVGFMSGEGKGLMVQEVEEKEEGNFTV